MPIFDQGYQHWSGKLWGHGWRWLAITRHGVRIGTAAPGAWGNSVIVAHRDTHFAFLRNLEIDEEIAIETATGALARYRVREVAIVDKTDTRVLDSADSAQLTLITCYPFDAVQPGSRQRYVVIAERVA